MTLLLLLNDGENHGGIVQYMDETCYLRHSDSLQIQFKWHWHVRIPVKFHIFKRCVIVTITIPLK